jgi:hypothetical protein
MSRLGDLLRESADPPATSATTAIHQAESSKSSKSSSPPPPKLIFSDLERRVRAMARRWQYSDTELTDVLARAHANPAGWERAVALDERREQEFRDKGLLPWTDA